MFNPVIANARIVGAAVAGLMVALRWCKPLECADSRADRALCRLFSTGFSTGTVRNPREERGTVT
jgi:hypothetical protein